MRPMAATRATTVPTAAGLPPRPFPPLHTDRRFHYHVRPSRAASREPHRCPSGTPQTLEESSLERTHDLPTRPRGATTIMKNVSKLALPALAMLACTGVAAAQGHDAAHAAE